MSPKKPSSRSPKPDIEPIPGSLPKKFPNTPEPLDTQPAKPSTSNSEAPTRSGSGEDPLVESGVPENDPEQPRESDEDKSMH